MADVLYLIRHSAPPKEARQRHWGRLDPGVDPECAIRAASLAGLIWDKPLRILSSPLPRALATARLLGGAWGAPVETDQDLAEIDYGLWDGLTLQEIRERHPDEAARWEDGDGNFAFPGGESLPEFYRRVERTRRRCLELPDRAVACVTHGGIVSAWCCLFLGMELDERCVFRADYSAVTAFLRKRDGSGWELMYFNNKE